MNIKQIISLFIAISLILLGAIRISAKNHSEFSISADKPTLMTQNEINFLLKNQENKIQYILSDVFSEKYAGQTVYINQAFKIYNQIIYMGGKCADYFSPIFLSDGTLIGFMYFTKGVLDLPPKDTYISISCALLDKDVFFPFEDAVKFLNENTDEEYMLCALELSGNYYGVLDKSNQFIILKHSEFADPKARTDNLSFSELSDQAPEAVISSKNITLNKSTAAAFEIKKLTDITVGAGVEEQAYTFKEIFDEKIIMRNA